MALLAAAGDLAGRETLVAAARELALQMDAGAEPGDIAALARALHQIVTTLPLARTGDDWEDFLDSLTAPTRDAPEP